MSEDARQNADHGATGRAAGAGLPRWVKRSLIATAILVVVMVVVMAISGGHHGPGRHLSGGARPSVAAAVLDTSGPGAATARW